MNPHALPKTSPFEMALAATRHRQTIFQMVKREILMRYRGSVLGIAWSFFTPLLMLCVYTFFFSVVFKARWNVETDNHVDYAVVLFVGLILYTLFSECINRAPQLILSNTNFVKKIIFPLEILPWITLGSALFHASISFGILIIGQFFLSGQIAWTIIFFPLILFPFLLMILGAVWFLAAAGVYFRDISHTTNIITSVLLFVSPVFYSTSMLPEKIHTLTLLNPLTVIITESRKILLFAELPNFTALSVYSLCSFLIAWSGFYFFQKTRKGFADVL
ncbi:MAG: ABC transporter permease [Gammaproteobacteria bacterium 39-13]|nr:ABC transporter permease [Gammaproteobacteria bacterium]OJV90493.1 MAG: ABC transporter permease [Gammaproteobacteria bacterium 39-13]